MVYGYARISKPTQSIDRQIRNIRQAYPSAIIIQEKYTGTKMDRPEWKKLVNHLREGDTVVFDSVSRLSRDANEGFSIYQKLYKDGIELIFLKEPHINTTTYKEALYRQVTFSTTSGNPATDTLISDISRAINQYLLSLAQEQIRLAFAQAEKEVSDLHQRTKEGIETARLAGRQIGQMKGAKLVTKKSVSAKKIIRQHSRSFGGSLTDIECARLAGVSRNTYYKYKREIKTEDWKS